MLIDGNRDLCQPVPFFHLFDQLRRREEFDPILRRVAQGLEQFGGDQNRHVMKLATEQPRDLLDVEPRRGLANQGQKLMLHFFHKTNLSNHPALLPPTTLINPVRRKSSSHRMGARAPRAPPNANRVVKLCPPSVRLGQVSIVRNPVQVPGVPKGL